MFKVLCLVLCLIGLWSAPVSAVPIAVFPLEDFSAGRNDVDLPFTRVLADYLRQHGNQVIGVDTVITFMANNRIRTVGKLESFSVFRLRDDLRAGFVLLGTVLQRKERPDPTMALTLSLVRATDARTIWSDTRSVTTSDERKALGIGEPLSTEQLQYLLLDEMFENWPWQRINEVQEIGAVNIDTVKLGPPYVRPGGEVNCRVRLLDNWPANLAPRIFFKADDQVYPVVALDDGKTFDGSWLAGEENGNVSVFLVLEWAQYARTETVLLGNYQIDGTPPLIEVELRGGKLFEGRPIFNKVVVIVPKMIVPKPIDRWHLAVNYHLPEGGLAFVGDMHGKGHFPAHFEWLGRGNWGDGTYEYEVEVWDKAGNSAKASTLGEFSTALPGVGLSLAKTDDQMLMDMKYDGKVPLRYWRLELWSKEGRLITEAEGAELPVQVGFKTPEAGMDQGISGFVFLQDAFGKQARVNVEELLPDLNQAAEKKEEKPPGLSESWVDEF